MHFLFSGVVYHNHLRLNANVLLSWQKYSKDSRGWGNWNFTKTDKSLSDGIHAEFPKMVAALIKPFENDDVGFADLITAQDQ